MPSLRSAGLLVALSLAAAGCGGSAGAYRSRTTRDHRAAVARRLAPAPPPVALTYRKLYDLPAPVQDPASAMLGAGRFVLLGGLDAADSSSAGVTVADLSGPLHQATLPGPQHDAQAAALDGRIYVFGGADFSQYDHILGFDPRSDAVAGVGTLPSPASDVAVAATGGSAYVVGGFDGSSWLDTIVAWAPGTGARIVAHLPVALRYAAVTAAGGDILIIGGSTPTGASDAIYRLHPASGDVQEIGHLHAAITHAGAAALGDVVYLVGGRGDALDSQTSRVWAIDPATGAVKAAGHLPEPLSDAGVLSTGQAIIVAGGRTPGATQGAVGELVPAPSG